MTAIADILSQNMLTFCSGIPRILYPNCLTAAQFCPCKRQASLADNFTEMSNLNKVYFLMSEAVTVQKPTALEFLTSIIN